MSITAKYEISTTRNDVYAYALKITVQNPDDSDGSDSGDPSYPTKIFVMQRGDQQMISGDVVDRFVNVASPVEIEEIPEDEPDIPNKMPYFRVNSINLWFRCLDDLNEAKTGIDQDIEHLVQTYDTLNDENHYIVLEEKTYGV